MNTLDVELVFWGHFYVCRVMDLISSRSIPGNSLARTYDIGFDLRRLISLRPQESNK